MTDIAIRVENLSKLYHIGARQQHHDTTSASLSAGLRDALVSTFKRPALSRAQGSSVHHDRQRHPQPGGLL
jgi:hypothetical protein